jgi:superfamily II RNA helicase
MAGLMAAIAADAERNYGELYLSDDLLDAVTAIEDVIYDVSNVEWRFGIEPVEEINLTAAAAAERWAGGMGWDELVKRTGAEEGDLFRLLSRTGEALMQLGRLRDSNPEAARIASETADLLLRDPIR